MTGKQFNFNSSIQDFFKGFSPQASSWQVHFIMTLLVYCDHVLQEEDESKMHDTDLDVDKYTSMTVDYSSVQPGSQQIDR